MKYPKVTVQHIRKWSHRGKVLSKGGSTLVELEIRKGVFYSGVAYCWKGDVYNKRKGKSIAFGRLMSALVPINFPQYKKTQGWILSKIGKVDFSLVLKALDGKKIE